MTTVERQRRLEVAGQGRLEIGNDRSYYKPPDYALPASDWRPPRLSDLPSSWRDAKRVGIDVECRDEDLKTLGPGCRRDPRENYVCGVSFAIEDGGQFYLPVRHEDGGNCDWDVFGYLRDRIREFSGDVVMAKGEYDLDWLASSGCPEILEKNVKDVQILDVLLNELHDRYNLDELCTRYELPGKDETLLRQAAGAYRVDPKAQLWRMHSRFVGPYAEVDARRPLQVMRRQERKLDEEGVHDIWKLEQRVTPILVKMRRQGLRIDVDHLEAVERMSTMKEAEHLDRVRQLTGVTIRVGDVWKVGVIGHALKAIGMTLPLTPERVSEKTGRQIGGKESVDEKFLKRAGKVGTEILRARKWNKLRTTFAKQVREQLINGRVHCTFNQLKATDEQGEGEGKGVRYGRLSCSNFNIQYQPGRDDEFGSVWRQIYVADLGARFGSSDWSQQEPRIGVHYAELLKLPGAREFGDEYRRNPKLDVHQKLTDLADDPVNLPRKVVKNFVNGKLYGMGDAKLCRSLGWALEQRMVRGEWKEVPTAESQVKIDAFDKFAPWIKGLTREAALQAQRVGHVWTWLRRKCRFERMADGKIWKGHKAFNRIGQGTAADQMKATLVACYDAGIPIQAAVHDEFLFSFDRIETAETVRHLQKTVVKFSVPMHVDLEVGDSWGSAEKVQEAA